VGLQPTDLIRGEGRDPLTNHSALWRLALPPNQLVRGRARFPVDPGLRPDDDGGCYFATAGSHSSARACSMIGMPISPGEVITDSG
jgi:hypothetical protein